MRIVGIDPGFAIVGYGVVDYVGNHFTTIDYGTITTCAGVKFERRLEIIYDELDDLLKKYNPDAIAIEELFFNSNQKTAIQVGQARGVIILCAVKSGAEVYEYTPLQVKQAVVGYGRAEKKQIEQMTRIILNLESVPKQDDAADALALAICHAHSSGSALMR